MPAGAIASPDGTGTHGRLLPTGRLEAFSDGVFAIAITLLVALVVIAIRQRRRGHNV